MEPRKIRIFNEIGGFIVLKDDSTYCYITYENFIKEYPEYSYIPYPEDYETEFNKRRKKELEDVTISLSDSNYKEMMENRCKEIWPS